MLAVGARREGAPGAIALCMKICDRRQAAASTGRTVRFWPDLRCYSLDCARALRLVHVDELDDWTDNDPMSSSTNLTSVAEITDTAAARTSGYHYP